MLNVAQITSYYPPHLGGVETVAERLAEGLSRHHRVWVITTTAGATGALRHVERRNLRVNRYRSRRVANVELFPGALVGMARLPRGTVLHAHVTEAFVPELAGLAAQLGKGPLVATTTWTSGPRAKNGCTSDGRTMSWGQCYAGQTAS